MITASAPKRCVVMLACLAALASSTGSAQARNNRETKSDEVVQGRVAGAPVLAVVALQEQRVTIYDANGPVLRAPISSGRTEYETPVGVFSVVQKEAEHYSNRYDDASMPFMERITWSGIALHAGALPSYPASHGCIRLPYEFAERLFGLTKLGLRVVIARSDVAPVPVSHPRLLKPNFTVSDVRFLVPTSDQAVRPTSVTNDENLGLPVEVTSRLNTLQSVAEAKKAEADVASQQADKAKLASQRFLPGKDQALGAVRGAEQEVTKADHQVTEAERDLQSARSPAAMQRAEDRKARAATSLNEAQRRLEAIRGKGQPTIEAADRAIEAATAAESHKKTALEAAREAKRKLWPVSIFISLKTQRLYVRQGFEPVMEIPVTIRDPDKPIGTHIFTAVDYANGDAGIRWTVVSLGGGRSDLVGRSDRDATPPTDMTAATAALDRITIPQEVIDRFSDSVWVGSSLIISDEDQNKETGPATDFIVVSSTDPQGGLKMRKPEPPARYVTDQRSSGRREDDAAFRHPFGGFFANW
jgi:hypothetical protein